MWYVTVLFCETILTKLKCFHGKVIMTASIQAIIFVKTIRSIILMRILCVSVCAWVCVTPTRSHKLNVISPRSFHQHKEILAASYTICMMSSLVKRKVMNAPFAFHCSFNVWCTKPRLLCNTSALAFQGCKPSIVTHNTLTREQNIVSPHFFCL